MKNLDHPSKSSSQAKSSNTLKVLKRDHLVFLIEKSEFSGEIKVLGLGIVI